MPYTGNNDSVAASKMEKMPTAAKSIGAFDAKFKMPDGWVSSGIGVLSSRMKKKGMALANITTDPSTKGSQPSMPMMLTSNGPAPKLADDTLE